MILLNPNISTKDAEKLIREVNERNEKLWESLFERADKIEDVKARNQFLSMAIPILAMAT